MFSCDSFQVGKAGKVVGIDHIKELVDFSRDNIQKDHPELLESGQVELVGELQIYRNQEIFFIILLFLNIYKYPDHDSKF